MSHDVNKESYDAEIHNICELCSDDVEHLNDNNLCTHCQLDIDINSEEQKNDID